MTTPKFWTRAARMGRWCWVRGRHPAGRHDRRAQPLDNLGRLALGPDLRHDG